LKNRVEGAHNLRRALSLFSESDKKKLLMVVCIQFSLSLLDLFGVAVLGVLGSVAVNGLSSSESGERVQWFLEMLNLQNFDFRTQILFLALLSAAALLSRTVFSLVLSNRIIRFLSFRSAKLSSELIHKLLSTDIVSLNLSGSQRTIYSVSKGVNVVIVAVVAVLITLLSDIALLVTLFAGLFLVNPLMATCCLVFFSLVGVTLYTLMHSRAKLFGSSETNLEIGTYEKLLEVLSTFRQSKVGNRRGYYIREISNLRYRQARISAKRNTLPNISKYVIDASIVIGALLMGAYAFTQNDASLAVGTLSVFVGAGSRIAPAVLRIQQGAVQIRGGLGLAGPTLDLFSELESISEIDLHISEFASSHGGFKGDILVENLSYSYPNSNSEAIAQVSFKISHGTSIAIVGPSGAGKSTLVDLILGMVKPDSGLVKISGVEPDRCFAQWPGAVSYVPQDSFLAKGSIRDNICLGFDSTDVPTVRLDEAIRQAGLSNFIGLATDGLSYQVGESGSSVSGGEAQRIGIARALISNPGLLVLDEATSSLDSVTEETVTEAIRLLKGSTTLVIVAHRLSTVRDADLVLYLDGGRMKSIGTFDKVRNEVPDFDRQAKLMGL
jgi:ABC-type multidrug transport system fused ATPase/permease subunit